MPAPRRARARVHVAALLLLAVGAAACSAAPQGVEPDRSATSQGASAVPRTSPPSVAARLPAFSASVSRIGPRLRERMTFTYREGCPVPLRRLRLLRVGFVDFGGSARTGRIVVHAAQSREVVTVFRRLYAARWRIDKMRLVDRYEGDDGRSMAANNTSGFNCRRVAGADRWSEHSYGRAIDINPVQNPFVVGSSVLTGGGTRGTPTWTARRTRPAAGASSAPTTRSSGPSRGSAGSGAARGSTPRTTSTSRRPVADREPGAELGGRGPGGEARAPAQPLPARDRRGPRATVQQPRSAVGPDACRAERVGDDVTPADGQLQDAGVDRVLVVPEEVAQPVARRRCPRASPPPAGRARGCR